MAEIICNDLSLEETSLDQVQSPVLTMESLKDISSQFFEMVPVRRIKWRDEDADLLVNSQELQIQLMKATIKHPVCLTFPPSLSYRRYFMKLLIQKLESQSVDIADEVYEAYTDLLSCPDEEDEMLCYKSYLMPTGDYVSLQESVHLVSQGTTGLSTWQAAQHLAEWILENPQIVANRTVTELGCGLGFTGITVCKSCAVKRYSFTDCHRQVLYLLAKNIQQNLSCEKGTSSDLSSSPTCRERKMLQRIRKQLSISSSHSSQCCEVREDPDSDSIIGIDECDRIKAFDDDEEEDGEISPEPVELSVDQQYWESDSSGRQASLLQDPRISLCHLDWESASDKTLESLRADVILAADVVYDPSIIPGLVYVLKSLLHVSSSTSTRSPKAYIASTIRNEDTRDAFLIAIASEGLTYSVVDNPKSRCFFYDLSVPIEILEFSAL